MSTLRIVKSAVALILAGWAIGAVAAPVSSAAVTEAEIRGAIARVEAEFERARAACAERFAVTACESEAKAQRRSALQPLQAQLQQLLQAERMQRAQASEARERERLRAQDVREAEARTRALQAPPLTERETPASGPVVVRERDRADRERQEAARAAERAQALKERLRAAQQHREAAQQRAREAAARSAAAASR